MHPTNLRRIFLELSLKQNVQPTNKRHLLAVDVSGSMQYGGVNGSPQIKPALAAAAMMMVTARTEADYTLLAFSKPMDVMALDKDMSLQEIHQTFSQVCAQ